MEFVCIFDANTSLLTVHYEENSIDEFSRLFRDWTDIEYLEDFFSKNEIDLLRDHWKGISIEQAVLKTRNDAIKLRTKFSQLSSMEAKARISKFQNFFKPLEKFPSQSYGFDKKKVYGSDNKSWIRIYALKIGNDMYLITGGAIKLTDTMDEREHTRKELKKLERCKDFFNEQGIVDDEGMIEFLELDNIGN
jgi:hypothetical protein